jgi:N-acetylmuramoyl-L-alanine amidase
VYYQNNQLVIRVKHQPKLKLKGMRIALDAGHGGEATGAVGTTGLREKDMNLELVMMLKAELEKQGAYIILTRSDDSDISMQQRMSYLSEQNPDILVSIHNNAGGSPITAKGTSTYYRHIGYRPLSMTILNKLLELGIDNFGLIGSFNFALSSPTEYPNVLVEGLFMDSPEDEAKLLDKNFKTRFVKKIVEGLKDYIEKGS